MLQNTANKLQGYMVSCATSNGGIGKNVGRGRTGRAGPGIRLKRLRKITKNLVKGSQDSNRTPCAKSLERHRLSHLVPLFLSDSTIKRRIVVANSNAAR
jgi:hypothetical protein